MKKIVSILSFLALCMQTFSQVQNVEITFNGKKSIIPIAVIDSITYEHDDTSYFQLIWNKGHEYKMDVYDVEQLSFSEEKVAYNNFSAKEYGIENGLINSLGQYVAVGKDSISNNGAVIIMGDVNENKPQMVAHVDSLKLLRYVFCDSIIYRYFYGKEDFTILALNEHGDSLNCETFAYNLLQQFQTKTGKATRAGGTISNSGWFNLFSLIDMSNSVMNGGTSSLLSSWASIQRNPLLSFGGDLAGLVMGPWYSKALTLIKWFDNIWNAYVFRGATIKTLPHKALSIDAVRLGCNITGLQKIPKIRNLEAYALCSMKMRAKSGLSGAPSSQYMNWNIQSRNIESDGEQYFDFQNLLLESQYEYYPQLNLAWTEAQANILVEISDDVIPDITDWTVVTEEHKSFQSIRGDEMDFFTTKPDVITGDVYYIYTKSAVVGCSFANVPNDASCGIEYSNDNQANVINISNKEGVSFPTINNLQPGTSYTFRAFVQTKYKKYYGKENNFTTKVPSCSTGEIISKTENSAIVECYYANVEDGGFECGVVVSSDNKTRKISTNSSEGKHEISISGLSPATTYSYWAYVEIDGIPINGEVKSFTTLAPSIVGTWNVVETYETRPFPGAEWETKTREYSLSLNEDGSISKSDTEYIGGSWSYSSGGSFYATGHIIATQTQNTWDRFDGKVDDIKNPQKITGTRYRGNMNQVTYAEEAVGSFVMTK